MPLDKRYLDACHERSRALTAYSLVGFRGLRAYHRWVYACTAASELRLVLGGSDGRQLPALFWNDVEGRQLEHPRVIVRTPDGCHNYVPCDLDGVPLPLG